MPQERSNRRTSSSGTTRKRRSSRSNAGGRRPLQGRDTGLRVGNGRRQRRRQGVNQRLIIVGVIGILLIIALIFGITTCVRGCNSSRNTKKDEVKEQKVNPNDKRVAYGVSNEVTSKLSSVLDRNEDFETIAKNANKIADERLIDLAINEPEAIAYVASTIKNDGSTQPYAETVAKGEYPKLFTFDARWGYAEYADGTVGAVGSGPVALSMASMGLSGKTAYDPTTVAKAVHATKLDNGSTGMDDSFVTNHASDAGVAASKLEASSDGMYAAIVEDQPVLIKLKSDSGIGAASAHWALIIQLNADNSITLYDPTSAIASSHSWSLGAVSSRTDNAYGLTAAAGTAGGNPGADASQAADAASDTGSE